MKRLKPLPRWVGVVGMITTTIGAANESGLLKFIPHPWGSLTAALGSFVAMMSHSLTGYGGKDSKTTPPN